MHMMEHGKSCYSAMGLLAGGCVLRYFLPGSFHISTHSAGLFAKNTEMQAIACLLGSILREMDAWLCATLFSCFLFVLECLTAVSLIGVSSLQAALSTVGWCSRRGSSGRLMDTKAQQEDYSGPVSGIFPLSWC